jgi:hypothetical protein
MGMERRKVRVSGESMMSREELQRPHRVIRAPFVHPIEDSAPRQRLFARP